MSKSISEKGYKYYGFLDENNKQYRIFLRTSKNKEPSFSICIIEEVSSIESAAYKKTFLIQEFNEYVKNYKTFYDINEIQNELMNNISNKKIKISQFDNMNKLIQILLNNNFTLTFKAAKCHDIFEYNDIIRKQQTQSTEFNKLKKKIDFLSNEIKQVEDYNQQNENKLQKVKDLSAKLYKMVKDLQLPPPVNELPEEDDILLLQKEERYRVLGIESDIVHSVKEVFLISQWLSPEKATKLQLLFKGPMNDFSTYKFHRDFDNVVPTLILIEAEGGGRFGGFTNQTWKGENEYKKDNTAFLFSLDFSEKYIINPQNTNCAIYAKTEYFFQFGEGDLVIIDQCNKRYCRSDFPKSYLPSKENGAPNFRLTRYKHDFVVKDIEVFLVSFTLKNYI